MLDVKICDNPKKKKKISVDITKKDQKYIAETGNENDFT